MTRDASASEIIDVSAEDATIVHSLRAHARHRREAVALVFTRGEGVDTALTYGELDLRARLLASRLQVAVPEGSLILLPLRSDAGSVVGLCACLYAGLACAPVPFPARNSTTRHLDAILAASGCAAVVASGDTAGLEDVCRGLPLFSEEASGDAGWTPPGPRPSDLAIVQYTSGSAAEPKGVLLSHGNVHANLEMLRIAFGVGPDDRFASWLPLFHDMGLATMLMPLHFGVPGALMAPLTFLRRPERWWQMVASHAATITGAPNFAYQQSVSRIAPEALAGLDLHRLKLAFCGAEPVRLTTLRLFARHFAPTGFRGTALYPCYGMSEAVCLVAGGHLNPKDLAETAAHDAPSATVSCGTAAAGSMIAIVDPDTHTACGDRVPGEIWVAGPHIGSGYLNAEARTVATFGARLAGQPNVSFLRTGDLGFLDAGALTILGRRKDVIIHRGGNIHAADVEAVVASCHPGFGSEGAAFAWEEQEVEHVVLVQEAARGFEGPHDAAMLDAALDAVALHYGVRLLDLVLVKAGSIPKTSSGKVRRDACRTLYALGALQPIEQLRAGTMLGAPMLG